MPRKVDPIIDPAQLQKDLAFSEVDLSSAFMQQAGLFAHYAMFSAKASKQVDDLKMMAEITTAQNYRKVREELEAAEEKITDKRLEQELAVCKAVLEARKAVNEAKMIADLAKSALEAFKQRRDMLVQSGVAAREELKGEARVIAKNSEREARNEALRNRLAQD